MDLRNLGHDRIREAGFDNVCLKNPVLTSLDNMVFLRMIGSGGQRLAQSTFKDGTFQKALLEEGLIEVKEAPVIGGVRFEMVELTHKGKVALRCWELGIY